MGASEFMHAVDSSALGGTHMPICSIFMRLHFTVITIIIICFRNGNHECESSAEWIFIRMINDQPVSDMEVRIMTKGMGLDTLK